VYTANIFRCSLLGHWWESYLHTHTHTHTHNSWAKDTFSTSWHITANWKTRTYDEDKTICHEKLSCIMVYSILTPRLTLDLKEPRLKQWMWIIYHLKNVTYIPSAQKIDIISRYEDYCLTGCGSIDSGRLLSSFHMSLLPSSSAQKNCSSTLKMEIAGSSAMLVMICQTAWYYIFVITAQILNLY
jgi:hypothetical protein